MLKLLSRTIFIIFGFCTQASSAKPTMSFIDLISVPVLSSPRLSPNGKYLLYTKSVPAWEENKSIRHIWLTDIEKKKTLMLTNGEKDEGGSAWSPDSTRIAFLTRRNKDKDNQLYLISVQGGEAIRLTEHKTTITSLNWSNNGSKIYFLSMDDKSKKEKSRIKNKDDVYAFDEDYTQKHLWSVDVSSGETTKITSGDYSVLSYNLSLEQDLIIFQKSISPRRDDSHASELWSMDEQGKNQQQLIYNNSRESSLKLSPDSKRVLYVSWSDGKEGIYNEDNIFVIDTDGKNGQLLLADFDHEINSASWSKNGEDIYFVANLGVANQLFRLNLKSGKIKQLTHGKHTIRSWHYSAKSDTHVFSLRDNYNNGDFYLLASGNRRPKKITSEFDYLSETFELPLQHKISWKGADGTIVEGLLTYPNNYLKSQSYPLVVQTHGGPMSSDQYGIFKASNYIPALAAKGYVVLQPNYRGSVGYGDAFVKDMVGGYFRNSHLDVMAGVDYLIKLGIADKNKMVKMGWSAGGHMTNKIVTFTDRFKAASSGAGASNWISMYGQTDIRLHRGNWFGGSPWLEDAPIDTYWQQSPLKDVWKVTTPTLVLVGENDRRVPMPQSVEFYRAMKANGVDTHLYVAPRTGHGWSELRHRLFKMNIEMAWFEKHARGREFTKEKYPKLKADDSKTE